MARIMSMFVNSGCRNELARDNRAALPTKSRGANPYNYASIGLCASLVFAASVPSHAFELELGPVTGTLNSTAAFGIAWRLDDPKEEFIGFSNGGTAASNNYDDGNLNFDNNSTPVMRAWTLTSELALEWENYGLVLSGQLLYDTRNNDSSFHSNEEVREEIGSYADLLNAYVSAVWDIGDRSLAVKVGQQTLNWGESTFTPHGLNEINPANVNRFRVPGAGLDDLYEPTPMVWANMALTDSISASIFWQWRWERTEPDARGSFNSTNDFAVKGAPFVMLGFGRVDEPETFGVFDGEPGDLVAIRRGPDVEASDSGQYGGTISWIAEGLNSTQFGFYFANYHSRRPVYSGISGAGSSTSASYFQEYPEDIEMYGITFNADEPTTGLAIQGEYTHRRGVPLQVDDVELLLLGLGLPTSQIGGPALPAGTYIPGFRRFNYSQYTLSFTKIFGAGNILGADSIKMLLEASAGRVHNMPSNDQLRLSAPGTFCRGGDVPASAFPAVIPGYCTINEGFPTASAWGIRFGMSWDYSNVLPGLNIKPRLVYFRDMNGTSPDPLVLFLEDAQRLILGSEFLMGQRWSIDTAITAYFGGDEFNLARDRDSVSLSLRYTF